MKLDNESVVISVPGGKFHYVSITCSSLLQAQEIRKQILEKINVDGEIFVYKKSKSEAHVQ